MKVVHLAAYGGPYAGSFIPMLRAIGRTAERRGADLELIFDPSARNRTWLSELENDGLHVDFLPPHDRRTVRALRSAVSPGGASVVLHSHFSGFDVPAVLAGLNSPRAAVIWHVHTVMGQGMRVWGRNALKYRLAGSFTSRILCVGPQIEQELFHRLAPRGRVVLFPNAIDSERFIPATSDERVQARMRLGLPVEADVLLHFGWNWPVKGGDLYLRAVDALLAAGQGSRPLIAITAGGGAPAERLRAALALERAVRVIDPVSDVRQLYAAADVFVATSRSEGSSFAVAEALSCGLAVVATDIPAHRALATRGIASCRLTSLEPRAIGAAVRAQLTKDPDQRVLDGQLGREHILASHDLTPWSERLFDLYEEVLATRPHCRAPD